jgi:hypothetical protein
VFSGQFAKTGDLLLDLLLPLRSELFAQAAELLPHLLGLPPRLFRLLTCLTAELGGDGTSLRRALLDDLLDRGAQLSNAGFGSLAVFGRPRLRARATRLGFESPPLVRVLGVGRADVLLEGRLRRGGERPRGERCRPGPSGQRAASHRRWHGADEQRHHQHRRRGGRYAPAVGQRSQHPSNAVEHAAVGRGEHETRRRGHRGHSGERGRISDPIAAGLERQIVTAELALGPHLPRHPPDRGVVEEQGFDAGLQQVDEIVVPPDVRELVRQKGFELRGRQPGQGRRGQQHDGLEPSHHHRHRHER